MSALNHSPITSSTCISLAPTSNSCSQSAAVHGLAYDDAFLNTLPVLSQRPPPHQPIRTLNAAQFSDIHSRYLTTHPPDSVIFPFLHGLEGNNLAQNAFFANADNAPWKEHHNPDPVPITEDGAEGRATKGRIYPEIPRFRGLVWVAASDPTSPSLSPQDISSDDYTDDSSSTQDSEDDLDPCDDYSAMAGMPANGSVSMDLDDDPHMSLVASLDSQIGKQVMNDPALKGPVVKVPPNSNLKDSSGQEAHMHPVFGMS